MGSVTIFQCSIVLFCIGICNAIVLQCDFDTAQLRSTVLPCVCDNEVCYLEHVNVTERFQWRTFRGRTSSRRTGPDNDHTRGDNTGLYIYTEASGVEPNTTAQIQTPTLDLNGLACVTFWYHMFGERMGTLQALTTHKDGVTTVIWQRSGDQGNLWLEGIVPLPRDTRRVTFHATRGTTLRSDIALDDIRITLGSCLTTTNSATTTIATTTTSYLDLPPPTSPPPTTRAAAPTTAPTQTTTPSSIPTTTTDHFTANCTDPYHGRDCSLPCGNCQATGDSSLSPCDRDTARCVNGCLLWWIGETCTKGISASDFDGQSVTVGPDQVTADSISITWDQIQIEASLVRHYGYDVMYWPDSGEVRALNSPQTLSSSQTVTLSGLLYNTYYNMEIRPYRELAGTKDYGRFYPTQRVKTKCQDPVEPDMVVGTYAGTLPVNNIHHIVVEYKLPSFSGCESLSQAEAEYRRQGSSVWITKDAPLSDSILMLDPGDAGTYELRMTVSNNEDRRSTSDVVTVTVTESSNATNAQPTGACSCQECKDPIIIAVMITLVATVAVTVTVFMVLRNRQLKRQSENQPESSSDKIYVNQSVAEPRNSVKSAALPTPPNANSDPQRSEVMYDDLNVPGTTADKSRDTYEPINSRDVQIEPSVYDKIEVVSN